jgi:hypothetical protein
MDNENKLSPEFTKIFEDLVTKVATLEHNAASTKFSQERTKVVWACIAIGAICIGSTLLKSWLAQPNWIDGFILLIGVILCGLSLFSKFVVNPKNGSIIVDVRDVFSLVQKLNQMLH